MISNVVLKSKDRILFGVTIKQDTKSEFLSLTDLQEAYTLARIKNGWNDRRINDILSTNISSERVFYILKERKFIKTDLPAFMEDVEKQSLVKVMKKYGAYKTIGKGGNRTTMCEKYIWVMLALELNPEIYAKVVCWLADNLIMNRIEAGDKYNELCRACSKFNNVDYRSIGDASDELGVKYMTIYYRCSSDTFPDWQFIGNKRGTQTFTEQTPQEVDK